MKTLLIDNYDSYTHILGHYIWNITGERPVIIKNDSMSLEEIETLCFDNIVISPGPGRPEKKEDFGVCRQVLERCTRTPVLGVCLGHQGIGVYAGAEVIHAPDVMHGKHSLIRHTGGSLFKDLPECFSAVRYHSLVIDPQSLNENIEVLAVSEDDQQIMAIRLRNRPYYGVQFHPESVGTDYGEKILTNFFSTSFRLSLQQQALPKIVFSHKIHYKEIEWKEPAAVFTSLFSGCEYAFWLDTSLQTGNGCFSYMGTCEELYVTQGDTVSRRDVKTGRQNTIHKGAPENIYQILQREIRNITPEDKLVPFPFSGGLVGYFAYEFGQREVQGRETKGTGTRLPDSILMKADKFLVFDHKRQKLFLCGLSSGDVNPVGQWFRELAGSVSALKGLPRDNGCSPRLSAGDTHDAGGEAALGQFDTSFTRDRYLKTIKDIKGLIRDGETYEVCLTNEFFFTAQIDPLSLYLTLRTVNPAPYSAFLKFPQGAVLSSSPESFLKVGKDRSVKSEPMKGTRPRGKTPAESLRIREELLSCGKDSSELLMITDLIRNDLARVCEPGTVYVRDMKKLTEYATVIQQTSTVTGKLREECGSLDLLEACFPGGSITGAPKTRTMEIISRFEKRRRGVYTGSIGYLGFDGTMDLNIAIRTLVMEGDKVSFGAGGAIVAESEAEKEWEEVMVKARALIKTFKESGKLSTAMLR
ncbi:aminodeoxychorismate synthase component I [Fibrobacterota bacterium]